MLHKWANYTMFAVCFLGSSACSVLPATQDDLSFTPIYPEHVRQKDPVGGSLFSRGTRLSLYEDIKAHKVGDIITVVLGENLSSEKKAESGWSKNTSISMANPTILGHPVRLHAGKGLPYGSQLIAGNAELNANIGISDTNSFAGSAKAKQSNKLEGTITVSIAQILPNGNLYVKGERWITINSGEELIRIAGIVRPRDISPDNTVSSQRIADARIRYSGEGSFANSSKPGWLVNFFSGPWWPF